MRFNKKGFTLVELLAIIVVLAIIALIVTPIVLKVITVSEKGSFKETTSNIIHSGDVYRMSELMQGNNIDCVTFDFSSSIEEKTVINGVTYVPVSELKLNGQLPTEGKMEVCGDTVYAKLGNNKYVAQKLPDESEIKIFDGTIGNTDTTAPEILNIVLSSTTNNIKVVVSAFEGDGSIDKYYYSVDGTNYVESSSNSYTFNSLESNKEYTVYVKVINEAKLETIKTNTIKTLSMSAPTLAFTNTPTTAVNGYLKQQVIGITYSGANITSPQYFVKTSRAGTSSIATTQSCGTSTNPGTCTNITSTTSLAANTWYKVSGNVNVTYTAASTTTGTIYAITYDGTNYSGASTGTISKIEPNLLEICDDTTCSKGTIYYNPETAQFCSKSDYEVNTTASNTENTTGCMKWYTYKNNGNGTYQLILDHNTTAYVAWDSSIDNTIEMNEVATALKNNTSTWNNSLNARLITADEIAEITGNTVFNGPTSTHNDVFYFDTNTTTPSATCTSGDTSGCKYGWLYDRTSISCTTYGCLNNADSKTYGYWTSTLIPSTTIYVFYVRDVGYLYLTSVTNTYGIRPVITV